MDQEKKEPGFFKKLIDSHKVLGESVTDKGLETYLGTAVKSIIERNTYGLFRTDFILEKLARYAAEGKIAQVARLLNIRPDLRIEVLFTLAGLGAQDEMEVILKQHPEDLLVSHPLRDISGAEFVSITLLQHAIWTKDVRYMANMFLDCLPKNEQGEKIRAALEQQVKEQMDRGVVYQLNDVWHMDVHFNIQPLLTAQKIYVNNCNDWTEKEREWYWGTEVGSRQVQVPAIIRHHYCDPDESFCDKPDFKKLKLKRSLKINNWVAQRVQLWSEALFGLDSNFGMCGADGNWAMGVIADKEGPPCEWVDSDLASLTALDEVRTKNDMPALIERLHIPVQNLEDNLDVQQMDF